MSASTATEAAASAASAAPAPSFNFKRILPVLAANQDRFIGSVAVLGVLFVVLYWVWVSFPVLFYTYLGNEVFLTVFLLALFANVYKTTSAVLPNAIVWILGLVWIVYTSKASPDVSRIPMIINLLLWLFAALYFVMTMPATTAANAAAAFKSNLTSMSSLRFPSVFSTQAQAPTQAMTMTTWTKHAVLVVVLFVSVCMLYVYNPYNVMHYIGGPMIFLSLFVGMAIAVLALSYQRISVTSMVVKSAFVLMAVLVTIGLLLVSLYVFKNTSLPVGGWVFNVLLLLVFLAVAYRFLNGGRITRVPVTRALLWQQLQNERNITSRNDVRMLGLSVLIGLLYFAWMKWGRSFLVQRLVGQFHGTPLLRAPVSTDKVTSIAPPESLSHRFAISFWFYVNSSSTANNPQAKTKYNVVSFGDYPSVVYHNNCLYVYEHARLLYVHHNVYLQKWNHVLINANGGTLDVFYNGELVRSNIEVVPYIKQDMFVVGQENGLSGDVANIVHFDAPVSLTTVQTIYQTLKDMNPPVPVV